MSEPDEHDVVDGDLRLVLKSDDTRSGFVDGAWWPHSGDLRRELPALVAAVGRRYGQVERVAFDRSAWEPAGRARLVDGGFRVALDGFGAGNTERPVDLLG